MESTEFPHPPAFGIARRLFLGLLAIVYGIAFLSLWVQVAGLYGHDGLAPIHETLVRFEARFGDTAGWRAPSLFWWFLRDLPYSNAALHGLCAAGVGLAGAALSGAAPRVLFFPRHLG